MLLMGWIDGTGLKNIPAQITIAGVLVVLIIVLVILAALRRAEYNYFEALARAAAAMESEETGDELAMELEENRGARLKNYLLRDPEKLFLTGKILFYSARNRGIGQKMVEIAIEYAPELKEFQSLSCREAAQRYISLGKNKA